MLIRSTKNMEPLDKTYRPRISRILFPAFLIVMLSLFITAIISTGINNISKDVALIFGTITVIFEILFLIICVLMLFYTMRIWTQNKHFQIRLSLFKLCFLSRDLAGVSWYPVSLPSRSIDSGDNDFCRYRIEVEDAEGKRFMALGGFLCWLYGIDCL